MTSVRARDQAVGFVEQEAPENELNLLIREARRRQRRRRLALTTVATAVLVIAVGLAVAGRSSRSPTRLIHGSLPGLGPQGQCPASPATFVSNAVYDATVLGRGTVRLAIGNRYDRARGRVVLGTTEAPGWSAMLAIWVTAPGYDGTFVVRGRRLGAPGPIDVHADGTGLHPGAGPLSIPAEADNTGYGFRIYPGSVWVRSSGCYAVQITGRGLSESIVFDAQAPVR